MAGDGLDGLVAPAVAVGLEAVEEQPVAASRSAAVTAGKAMRTGRRMTM
jgi:hypothetical protein